MSSRPLTPPCVRFRTRRFNSLSAVLCHHTRRMQGIRLLMTCAEYNYRHDCTYRLIGCCDRRDRHSIRLFCSLPEKRETNRLSIILPYFYLSLCVFGVWLALVYLIKIVSDFFRYLLLEMYSFCSSLCSVCICLRTNDGTSPLKV